MAGDGQVSLGNTVMKGNARKVRRLYHDKILAGFAGGTADAFTLFERFEAKLEAHQGHLTKAAVELAKDWRTDRALRKLEALLAVADETASFIITGNGDVVQPEQDLIAIGSGGNYAQAAATALLENTELSANSDTLVIPSSPVIHMAIALLSRERGETGGTSTAEYFAIADKHLSDAIALDAQKHPEETIFYTP